jgi:hypothetical protein
MRDRPTIQTTDRGSREGQALGGVVLLAVSDPQYCDATGQPAALGLVRVSPIMTPCFPIAATIFLAPTPKRPAVVAHALPELFRWLPGLEEDICGATEPAVTRITASLSGELVCGGTARTPAPAVQRYTEEASGPHQEHHRQTPDGLPLATGTDPGQPVDSRGLGIREHRIISDYIAPRTDEEGAEGQGEESGPRSRSQHHPRPAVMGHSFQRLGPGHTAVRCRKIESCSQRERERL